MYKQWLIMQGDSQKEIEGNAKIKHKEMNLLTEESILMAASGDLMFFTSHTFTVRSSLPDTTLSDPANNALVTGLSITISYLYIKLIVKY